MRICAFHLLQLKNTSKNGVMVVLACYLDGGYAHALSGGMKDRQRVNIRTNIMDSNCRFCYHRSPVEENRQSAFQTAATKLRP